MFLCRWVNAVSLGASRKNFAGQVPLADACWYFFRLPSDLPDVPVVRLQKRLLHLIGQRLEENLCSGHIHLRQTPPRPGEEAQDASTPWSSGTRNQISNVARQELLRRFIAKNSGFVRGLRDEANVEICELDKGTRSHSTGSVAAGQFCTAYFVEASGAMLRRMHTQDFKHLSWYEDSSRVGTHEAGVFLRLELSVGFVFKSQLQH